MLVLVGLILIKILKKELYFEFLLLKIEPLYSVFNFLMIKVLQFGQPVKRSVIISLLASLEKTTWQVTEKPVQTFQSAHLDPSN